MTNSAYKLDLKPISLENYSFGKIELDDFQLTNLNLTISKLSKAKEVTFNDSFGIEWEFSFVAFIDYLLNSVGDPGPFLIITGNYLKWADVINNINGIKPLIYRGNQQERKLIRSNQMFNSDNSLKFNLLISALDLTEIDFSSINEVYYHLAIFNNFKKVKYMPKSYKIIRYIQNFSNTFPPDLFDIEKFTDDTYYDDPDPERQNEKIENFQSILSISSKPLLQPPEYYYINCPLSNIQKAVLKKLIFQSEANFSTLCQIILRVCSHPFLIFGIESLLGPVNYIESSTKLAVFAKLITEKLTDAKKILVISQFNGMLDLIEDFATENKISYQRLIDDDFSYEDQNTLLILYNPLFYSNDIITEFIDYFIILDGDHSIILDSWLRNANRELKAVITLQCQELFETRLTKICMRGLNMSNKISINEIKSSPYLSTKSQSNGNKSLLMNSLGYRFSYIYSNHDSNLQYEEFMSELLCKIASSVALSSDREISIDSIIDNPSNEPIETNSIFDIQFCQALNFWDVLKSSIEYQTKPEFPLIQPVVDDGKHKWTLRERDQLIRGLIAFGWDRWDDIIRNGGLIQISKEEIVKVSRSFLRFLLVCTNSTFPLIRQFIRESIKGDQNSSFINDEKADRMFMEKDPVFSQQQFKAKMKSNAEFILKRIESLSYLRHTVEAYIDNISGLPLSRTIGNSPTDSWTRNHDRILLLGSYKYGFGGYDHFPEDQDPRYRDVSFCADQNLLNECLIKLTENLKRMHDAGFRSSHVVYSNSSENSDNFDEGYKEGSSNSRRSRLSTNSAAAFGGSNSGDDDNNNDEIDDSNSHSNLSCHWSSVEKKIVNKFIYENGILGDYEFMKNLIHIDTKTVEQLKEYCDDYIERCNKRIKKGIQAMEELRTILDFEIQNHSNLYRFQSHSIIRKPKNKGDDSDDDFDSSKNTSAFDNSLLFDRAPHWKKFPEIWTPNVERFFFTQLAIKGLGSIDKIKMICESKKIVDFKNLPPFVLKFDSLIKRIQTIYNLLIQMNPSFAQFQIRQNSVFYKYQQSQIQQEIQNPDSKSGNQNSPKKPPQIDLDNRKSNETTIQITTKVKSPIQKKSVKKSSKENHNDYDDGDDYSKENSQSENETNDYNDNSDYDDDGDYKSRKSKVLQSGRRNQIKPVISTKEELNYQTKKNNQAIKQKVSKPKPKPIQNFDSISIDNFTFPVQITTTSSILNIGEIVYDRPAFHTERYIYPAGYKSMKVYASIDDPNERANYISEIIDNGSDAPLFRVTMEGSNHVFEGNTPTAPWTNVLKEVFNQGKRRGYSVSGPEAFMIAQPKVLFLIQLLPNIEKCQKYVPKSIASSVVSEMIKQCKQEKESNNRDGEANNNNNNNDDDDNKANEANEANELNENSIETSEVKKEAEVVVVDEKPKLNNFNDSGSGLGQIKAELSNENFSAVVVDEAFAESSKTKTEAVVEQQQPKNTLSMFVSAPDPVYLKENDKESLSSVVVSAAAAAAAASASSTAKKEEEEEEAESVRSVSMAVKVEKKPKTKIDDYVQNEDTNEDEEAEDDEDDDDDDDDEDFEVSYDEKPSSRARKPAPKSIRQKRPNIISKSPHRISSRRRENIESVSDKEEDEDEEEKGGRGGAASARRTRQKVKTTEKSSRTRYEAKTINTRTNRKVVNYNTDNEDEEENENENEREISASADNEKQVERRSNRQAVKPKTTKEDDDDEVDESEDNQSEDDDDDDDADYENDESDFEMNSRRPRPRSRSKKPKPKSSKPEKVPRISLRSKRSTRSNKDEFEDETNEEDEGDDDDDQDDYNYTEKVSPKPKSRSPSKPKPRIRIGTNKSRIKAEDQEKSDDSAPSTPPPPPPPSTKSAAPSTKRIQRRISSRQKELSSSNEEDENDEIFDESNDKEFNDGTESSESDSADLSYGKPKVRPKKSKNKRAASTFSKESESSPKIRGRSRAANRRRRKNDENYSSSNSDDDDDDDSDKFDLDYRNRRISSQRRKKK